MGRSRIEPETPPREFKFDSGRARYLWQDYDTHYDPNHPADSAETFYWTAAGPPRYTDYQGDSAYLDGTLSGPDEANNFNMTGSTRYFGGSGQQALNAGGGVEDRRYFHGDLIDSNVMTTDHAGAAVATTAYTAFGEAISWHAGAASPSLPDDPEALGTRYQYAGQWGYEAPTSIDYTGGGGGSGTAPFSEGPGLTLRGVNPLLPPITLSHVGARWYQPGVGRFVQRDPIGLEGGSNLYCYVGLSPLDSVDPSGQCPVDPSKIPTPIDWSTRGLPRDNNNWIKQPVKVSWKPGRGFVPRPPATPPPPPPGVPGIRLTPGGGGAIVGVAVIGAGCGTAINNTFGWLNGGFKISDGLADCIYRRITKDPNYDPYNDGSQRSR